MPGKKQTKGICPFCHKKLTRIAMAKHLQTCEKRFEITKQEKGPEKRYLDILIYAKGLKEFWYIIQVEDSKKLQDLDNDIRMTWFDLMEHLSVFKIGWEEYFNSTDGDYLRDQKNMNQQLKSVLDVGWGFEYEYDFGTTTYLQGIVIGEHTFPKQRSGLRKLVRNEMPELICQNCEKEKAIFIDTYGYMTGKELWCKKCMNEYIKKHDDFDDSCLYFVANSPRMGFDACVMEFWMEDDEEEE